MNNQPYYLDFKTYMDLLASFGFGPTPPRNGYDDEGYYDPDEYSRERQVQSSMAAARGYEQPFKQQMVRGENWQPMPRNPTRDRLMYGLMDQLRRRGIR